MLLCSSPNYLIIFSQRKHEALEVDEEDSIIAESEFLWRINFERFIFCLKKKVCLSTYFIAYMWLHVFVFFRLCIRASICLSADGTFEAGYI
jgi:hypothetical protein